MSLSSGVVQLTLPALKNGDSSFGDPTCLAGLTTNRVVEAFQLAPLLGGEASMPPEVHISRSVEFGCAPPYFFEGSRQDISRCILVPIQPASTLTNMRSC